MKEKKVGQSNYREVDEVEKPQGCFWPKVVFFNKWVEMKLGFLISPN